MSEGWHRTFFDKAANDFWNAAVPPDHTAAEVELLVDTLALHRGTTVLDLPAGRGRLALPIADRGVRVIAVDYSWDGVRSLLGEVAGRDIDVIRADMRALPLQGPFDACYCMGNSFGYFDIAGVERFLAEVARVLRPGGAFALESASVAESLLADLAATTSHSFGGVSVVGHHRYDPEHERLVSELEVDDGVARRTHVIDQLVLPSDRIRRLVEGSGLHVEALLGGTSGESYSAEAGSLVLVARR